MYGRNLPGMRLKRVTAVRSSVGLPHNSDGTYCMRLRVASEEFSCKRENYPAAKTHGFLAWFAEYIYSGRTVLAYPESSGGLWPNIHGVETLGNTVLKRSVHGL